MASLFAGVGLSATGFIALVTVTPLVAEDLLGSARWSGLPSSLAIVGTAFGTTWLSGVMARRGRRRGLLLGYFTASAAAVVAAVATGLSLFPLLLLAIFGIGAGNGASRLSRYAAADLYEVAHQARAIGWVVWAGTVGSVLGPLLLAPARRLAASLEVVDNAGPYILVAAAMGAAGLVLTGGLPEDAYRAETRQRRSPPWEELGDVNAQIALVALVVGQVVMLLVMTMTPVHIRGVGGSFEAIGSVIAAHTFGMYALSPVSGYLSDRFGRRPIIVLAGALLVTAGFVAGGADGDTGRLGLGLFLLGWGWNLGFVSASALLTAAVADEARMRLQGFSDSVVWTSAAVAGVSSGVLLSQFGFETLCYLGSAMAVVPSLLIALRPATATARAV